MTKNEQIRLTNWRFKVLQQAGEARSVARTCRHHGISRDTIYKWRRRFAEQGVAGLCNRPGRPHYSPRAKPPEVIAKILYLRENYHFGACRIGDYLERFHQLSIARLFLNLENSLDVRQTREDPLVRRERAPDGSWTVDAWAPLEGFVANAGVRISFGG
jgi:transposase